MYANAVVDAHEDFDIVGFAEAFFDTGKQLLIVKEKGRKVHWHVHGQWIGDRKAYKEIPHADRKGEGQRKTRPVRVAFDKDEQGFKYCCKEDPPNVVKKWHISDEQIAKWHDEWTAGKEDMKQSLKRAMDDTIKEYCSHGGDPRDWDKSDGAPMLRSLKHACYGWLVDNDKLINPPHVRQHVLTYLWKEFNDGIKEFVLDQ